MHLWSLDLGHVDLGHLYLWCPNLGHLYLGHLYLGGLYLGGLYLRGLDLRHIRIMHLRRPHLGQLRIRAAEIPGIRVHDCGGLDDRRGGGSRRHGGEGSGQQADGHDPFHLQALSFATKGHARPNVGSPPPADVILITNSLLLRPYSFGCQAFRSCRALASCSGVICWATASRVAAAASCSPLLLRWVAARLSHL